MGDAQRGEMGGKVAVRFYEGIFRAAPHVDIGKILCLAGQRKQVVLCALQFSGTFQIKAENGTPFVEIIGAVFSRNIQGAGKGCAKPVFFGVSQ